MKSESENQEESIKLYRTGEHPCSYLPGQQARTLFLDPELHFNRSLYEQLTHLGFRRSGMHLYRPDCESCGACMPTRVRVASFRPKRRFRRVLKANSDLDIRVVPCQYSREHYRLYERYISQRHRNGDMYPPSPDAYRDFLTSRSDLSFIMEFRKDGVLLASAFTDRLVTGLSATYTCFEPEEDARSLGTFAILSQIQYCQSQQLPFLYLGYWVPGSQQMHYKADFQPMELLINRQWRPLGEDLIRSLTD
ncbi:MAG: arginyltransferase [Saccharospirillum sp.]|nr:arginyltransferase [Saccharospirillum sp.]